FFLIVVDFQEPLCEGARGLDIRWVIEQDQGLLRRVRTRAFHGAFLARRGVEGEQTRVQEGTLPIGVQAAAILVFVFVVGPVARWKVEELPVTRRLIRL